MSAAAVVPPVATHVSERRRLKERRVEELRRLLLERPVVAVVGLRGVPAANLQSMRRDLRARGYPLRVAPNSLIVHALESASRDRPALKQLVAYVQDQTGLVISDQNPFLLARELDATRSPVAPRGGEIAPRDVVVPAGETPFKPGPIVGELQHAGFPAAIEKGKVVIKKETAIVRQGSVISREVASLLARLEIKPLEVGLLLRAATEGDQFFSPEALRIDLDAIRADFVRAGQQALGLAVRVAYPTPESLPLILARAHRQALGLATRVGFATPETVPWLIRQAYMQARAIQGLQSTQ